MFQASVPCLIRCMTAISEILRCRSLSLALY